MGYTVDAVQEALHVLMHVAQCPGLGVTELAKRSGNTKARAFRLLSTLEQNGFVQRGPDETSYILGHMSLVLGMAAQEQVSLVRIAKRHLDELGARFNENFQIRVRDGLQSIVIAKWDSTRSVRVHSEIGSRRPLHAGATGKVLLAAAPEDVQSLVLGGPLERFTATTPSQRTKLTRELARVKAEGFGVSYGEVVPDVVALGVPVLDALGAVTAALGMSIPSSRAPEDLAPYVKALKDAARSVSQELGWRAGAGHTSAPRVRG
jgi:IclR family KDG regulon transcriptional repressor